MSANLWFTCPATGRPFEDIETTTAHVAESFQQQLYCPACGDSHYMKLVGGKDGVGELEVVETRVDVSKTLLGDDPAEQGLRELL